MSTAVVLLEVLIGFLPGLPRAAPEKMTAIDWFTLFQGHSFLGLRELGLLNLIGAALLLPTFLAMRSALRRDSGALGMLSTVLFFAGLAAYLSSNRAFEMLALSRQYAGAATGMQRSLLIAAGEAALASGRGRAGLILIEIAGLVISAAMLRGRAFSRATACAGIIGNLLLIVVEAILALERRLPGAGMVVAVCGGLSIITWYLLVGGRLLKLGAIPEKFASSLA
jgi:hypothetical protein